jgi:hypothetical protein
MGRDEAVPPSGVRDIVPHLRSRRALIPFVACWLVLTLLLGVASKSGNPEIRPDGAQAQHTVRPSGWMRPMQLLVTTKPTPWNAAAGFPLIFWKSGSPMFRLPAHS